MSHVTKETKTEDVVTLHAVLPSILRPQTLTILYCGRHIVKDVTQTALGFFTDPENILRIPSGDVERAKWFGDISYGWLKHIRVICDKRFSKIYTHTEPVVLDVSEAKHVEVVPFLQHHHNSETTPELVLSRLHKSLPFFTGGALTDEYPEQALVVMFLEDNAHVLELGSNIGRNTMIIERQLSRPGRQFVTLECDPVSYETLLQNRKNHEMQFQAENAALSYRPLQLKAWNSVPSEVPLEGHKPVETITFEELEHKHNIKFDTLIVDCEGALFYILQDRPSILNNIRLVIMENDYWDVTHKHFVDKTLTEKGLVCVFSQEGGWGFPTFAQFYEVWKRL